jgi:hypothetical protein
MGKQLRKTSPSSPRRGPFPNTQNGLGSIKNMVMGPETKKCWRGPEANYHTSPAQLRMNLMTQSLETEKYVPETKNCAGEGQKQITTQTQPNSE